MLKDTAVLHCVSVLVMESRLDHREENENQLVGETDKEGQAFLQGLRCVQKPRTTGLGANWEHKSPAKLRQRLPEGGNKPPGRMWSCHMMKPGEPRRKAWLLPTAKERSRTNNLSPGRWHH